MRYWGFVMDEFNQQRKRITTEVTALAVKGFKHFTGMLKPSGQPRCIRFHLPDGRMIDANSRIFMMLGRSDAELSKDPIDVDFADMDAAAHGVSHEHAVVQVSRNQVFVKDFNSRNGTYINEQELLPMHEYPLSDGDELVLGRLRVRVQFIY